MTLSGPVTLPRLSAVFILLCLLFLFRDTWLPPTSSPTLSDTPFPQSTSLSDVQNEHPIGQYTSNSATTEDECRTVAGADKVMVVLKTGSTEVFQKLPIHFLTTFRCTPHYLIFSDLHQTIANYQVFDAIDTVREDYKDNHEDFELYRKLKKYQKDGRDTGKLKGDKGWNLDKWKFMPMMHETYRMSSPEIDWFVIIEADTSLSWTNLLQWLGKLNPNKLLYMGAQNSVNDVEFAHGGSGFVVSRAAMKKMEDYRLKEGYEVYDERWAAITASSCCGDEVIARALKEAGVPLTPAWPRIQGETVNTLDWTKRHWCAPAVTWHHVSGSQVDAMWKYQTKWVQDNGWSKPYLFRNVFDQFVDNQVASNRTAWNNLSQDIQYLKPSSGDSEAQAAFEKLSILQQQSVESFDDCAEACRANKDCMQWMWEKGRCQLGKEIRLGDVDERESSQWKSGWLTDRLEHMKAELESCSINWTS